jgi:hypothetical protein
MDLQTAFLALAVACTVLGLFIHSRTTEDDHKMVKKKLDALQEAYETGNKLFEYNKKTNEFFHEKIGAQTNKIALLDASFSALRSAPMKVEPIAVTVTHKRAVKPLFPKPPTNRSNAMEEMADKVLSKVRGGR